MITPIGFIYGVQLPCHKICGAIYDSTKIFSAIYVSAPIVSLWNLTLWSLFYKGKRENKVAHIYSVSGHVLALMLEIFYPISSVHKRCHAFVLLQRCRNILCAQKLDIHFWTHWMGHCISGVESHTTSTTKCGSRRIPLYELGKALKAQLPLNVTASSTSSSEETTCLGVVSDLNVDVFVILTSASLPNLWSNNSLLLPACFSMLSNSCT